MNSAKLWPAALVAVLAITVAANVAIYWTANHDSSFAVEPDYYQRAIDWDSTVARGQRSDALGWAADVRLAPPDAGQATLSVTLAARNGTPLDSADVRAALSHNAHGANVFQVRLLPSGPGLYAARVPSATQGLWRVDLAATRGDDVFVERVTVDNGTPHAP
ncbi:MAG: FixH family protein [Gemmatimonadales bacterium]